MDKEAQDHKFNWGDPVVIAKNAPEKYHPSEIGFICGMIDIDSEEAALSIEQKTVIPMMISPRGFNYKVH